MRTITTGLFALSILALPVALRGQVNAPAPVSNSMPESSFGFNLPTHLGTLNYALTGTEMFNVGSDQGTSVFASTALSGNLAYMSSSQRFPFSMVYSGGLIVTTEPGNNSTETFQDLAVSQVAQTKSWVFVVSDSASFLPGSPTTGLSGVAGVGDVGVFPVQSGIGPNQSILANYSSRIANGLQGSATWQATASLDLEASGSWQVLHFTGGQSAVNTNQSSATFGPSYRIDARNSVGGSAYYSDMTYPGYGDYKIETEGVNINYTRAWTRKLSTTVSFGPSRTHGVTFTPIAQRWNLAGSAEVTYATRTTGFYGNYDRSVNGGSGIIFGALTDSFSAGMDRPINRDWTLGLQATYSRSVALAPVDGLTPSYNTAFGGAQLARRITQSLSGFASYTGISQSEKNQPIALGPAFNGINNVFSFGITFAPGPLLNGR
ncbi:MAG TPA: hypothetical protein VFW30_03005 [Bryocella sp.]|nr:hypothetical protein [Bryocella sp.]